MLALLIRLLRRLAPREGWLPFLLTLVAALCLPAALLQSPSGAAGAQLLGIAAAAVVAGLWLAQTQLRARVAAAVGTGLGAAVTFVSVARLTPPLAVLWQGGGATAEYVWQQTQLFGLRLFSWGVQATAGSGAAQDTIVVELALSLLVWAFGVWMAWQVYRRRSGWQAVAPGAVAISLAAFLLGGLSRFYFTVYLAAALSLVALCRLWRHRAAWEESSTDYPDGLGAELAVSIAAWLCIVLALATAWPTVRIRSVQAAFWRQMEGPWARLETVAERFVGPIESDYRPGSAGRGRDRAGGELPQSYLLGGRPDLDETIVFALSTNDPPPQEGDGHAPSSHPRRYWRRTTFDTYTGLGWSNQATEVEALAAGAALGGEVAPGPERISSRFDLVQQFEMRAGATGIYAANAPFRIDTPVNARWRAPGDLVELTGNAERYAVVSRVPEPTVDELRMSAAVAGAIPPAVAPRYLALPETLPERVVALAREVAGDAATQYDAVARLERYLRSYPYELDLPQPPDDVDLVDYFLFDLQEGYCDYYASALVVMARAVGVPARLATGYAQGAYDAETGRWVVTAEDGHSWAEVYFDGIGWVEFEPTAGQVALDRPGGIAVAETLPPLPARTALWWERVPWGVVVVVATAAGLVALLGWLWKPVRETDGAALVQDRYARLLRWGRRLRQPLRDGQTPREYASSLGTDLGRRGRDARRPTARQAAEAAPGEVDRLVETYVESRYSGREVPERAAWRVDAAWRRLRRYLLALWLRWR